MAEELHAGRGRQVLLVGAWRFDEFHLGAEGVVELVGAEGARMQRARDELPERVEILELGAARIIVMRRRVMLVGGDPQRVADLRAYC